MTTTTHMPSATGSPHAAIAPEAPVTDPKVTDKPPTPPHGVRRRRLMVPILLAIALGAVIYFLGIRPRVTNNRELATLAQQAANVSVVVVQPVEEASAPNLNLPASIQAKQQTSIYSRVSGYLKSWKADIGDKVKAGQLLAEIDAPDVDANVRSAQAQLELSEANLVLAKLNTARSKSLFDKKVISQQEFDTAKANEQVNQATRDRDAALLQLQRDMQGFEKILAPFDGTITTRYVDVGSLIAVGSATTVQKIFDLAETDPVRVFVNMPQANVSSLGPDASAAVTVDEYPGQTFAGKIARNAGAFDPASRAMTVQVDLPNPDGRLYPGMYAHVRFVVPNPKPALLAANNTILSDAKGTRVVTIDAAHKIRTKTVKLGRDYGTKTEILDGLDLHDSLVQNPTDDLIDGLAVSVQPSPTPSAPQKAK
jgi:membrane fusion protein (multidrug efflux system)